MHTTRAVLPLLLENTLDYASARKVHPDPAPSSPTGGAGAGAEDTPPPLTRVTGLGTGVGHRGASLVFISSQIALQ
jgi:hypothetical protein